MPRLSDTMFLRYLENERAAREGRQADLSGAIDMASKISGDIESVKDAQFKRDLEIAKLQGQLAQQTNKPQPKYESADLSQGAGLGYAAGEAEDVARKEAFEDWLMKAKISAGLRGGIDDYTIQKRKKDLELADLRIAGQRLGNRYKRASIRDKQNFSDVYRALTGEINQLRKEKMKSQEPGSMVEWPSGKEAALKGKERQLKQLQLSRILPGQFQYDPSDILNEPTGIDQDEAEIDDIEEALQNLQKPGR